MARVGRIAGALLAETGGAYLLVGNPKQPCDWRACGFAAPGELDARLRPVVPLVRLPDTEAPALGTPCLVLEVEGDALGRLLADTLVIPRTGSVSERLWRLVTGQRDEDDAPPPDEIAARWLGELPPAVWQIVRDTVLRCS